MPTLAAPTTEYVAAYGLTRPKVGDACEAVERVFGADAPLVWEQILSAAGAGEHDDRGIERVVDAMIRHQDGVVRLCAQALSIRLSSYTRLAATHAIVAA